MDKNLNPHWSVDSCASWHVIGNSDMVNKLHKQIYLSTVSITRSESHPVKNIGSVHFETPNGVIKTIDNVLYIPRLEKNLLSVGSMATKRYLIVFYDKKWLIIRKNDYKLVASNNHMTNSLYILQLHNRANTKEVHNVELTLLNDSSRIAQLWHKQFTNLNY